MNLDLEDSTDKIIAQKKLQQVLKKEKIKEMLGMNSSQISDNSQIDITLGSSEEALIDKYLENLQRAPRQEAEEDRFLMGSNKKSSSDLVL